MALSLDGRRLAAPVANTVWLWDLETGKKSGVLRHSYDVLCAAWSSEGTQLATGTADGVVHIWDARDRREVLDKRCHGGRVTDVAAAPDGQTFASSADDASVSVWTSEGVLRTLEGHRAPAYGVVWLPDGETLCSGSWDGSLRLWNTETWTYGVLAGHKADVNCVACTPDGSLLASGSDDQTVRVWDAETGHPRNVLEGHLGRVVSVAFLDDGRFLASLGRDGTVLIWRTDTLSVVLRAESAAGSGLFARIAAHPTMNVIALADITRKEINIWQIDFESLRGAAAAVRTIQYVNAKAVLLGESGVGKSGLGITLAEGTFRASEGSTHGAQFWHFPAERAAEKPDDVQAELTLWDLAGQPEYRLTHQLFLEDLDAALLLFDCSDANDPFRGVPYWAKVLKKQAKPHAVKLLVSARTDVSPVTASRAEIDRILRVHELDGYVKTSARTNEGVADLLKLLLSRIRWEQLPRTSTPELFQVIRDLLLERKNQDATLMSMEEMRSAAVERYDRAVSDAEIHTVIQLLQSRGLVYRVEPRPGVVLVLLKPERINQYGASIIHAARNHPQGIGAVSERDVQIGELVFAGFERLPRPEETVVLEATAELLLRAGLCFREMGYLVFPSQINVTRLLPDDDHPRTEVAYRFSGSIETIYASLVVRLSYTNYFRREDQWKYAVEFSREGNRLGFAMRQVGEGTAELEVYFHAGVSDFDRVTFIRFLTDHLRAKGLDIREQIRLYCPRCTREVANRDAIESRVREGRLEIPCQYCDASILIPKSVEERYRRDPALGAKQQELTSMVQQRTLVEAAQFRTDQRQSAQAEETGMHILHLSDLHVKDEASANVWRMQLETDLTQELSVRRLDYLVISGDIADRSTEEEYRAAFGLVDALVKRFGLDASRVVIVPGNHDVNWEMSRKAYPFRYRDDWPSPLPDGQYIPAGEDGVLLRDEELYRQRFGAFNTHFFRRVYVGTEFPSDPAEQTLWIENARDRILFVGLNTSWEIDHSFRRRASVHMPALARALDRILQGKYEDWLKIAVWHHPITGRETMDDEFMQLLAVHGFEICLHGHIHEATDGFYRYDDPRGIHIVGAGTFGARPFGQVPGVPLQYNLLRLERDRRELQVYTRKKEKSDGAWSADARWGSRNEPKASYRILLRRSGM